MKKLVLTSWVGEFYKHRFCTKFPLKSRMESSTERKDGTVVRALAWDLGDLASVLSSATRQIRYVYITAENQPPSPARLLLPGLERGL